MKEYEIVINGMTTTMLLSDAEAAARGLTAPKTVKAAPADEPEVKAKTPANKSRTAANKRAEIVDQAFAPKP